MAPSQYRRDVYKRQLVDEALGQLNKQQVPHLIARAVRRNASAMKFFKRSGFDWVRTEEYLLGRNM